jgi:hypothetical protein
MMRKMMKNKKTVYLHNQSAKAPAFVIMVFATGLPATFFALGSGGTELLFLPIAASTLSSLFFQLQTEVTRGKLHIRYGAGIIHKTVALKDIKAATHERHKPLQGWGLRWTPPGWTWSIYGLDVIELTYRNGKKFRVGTDDPKGLLKAISC